MPSRRRRYRYRPKPQTRKPPSNAEITTSEVRLIDVDGTQLGVVKTKEARSRAEEKGFDLVMVAQKADPPVVRILDMGKHLYEQRKKEAKQKAKSKGKDVKGIRISLKVGEHDWRFRLNQTARFFEAGHKVKVEVRLRGRERQRPDLAQQKITQFIQEIPGGATQNEPISQSGNSVSVTLTPPKK